MKLCGFDVGLDRPLLPDRRPLRRRVRAAADGRRRPAEGNHRGARHSLHLQVAATTRRTARRGTSFRGPGIDKGLEILAKVKRAARRAGADRRAPRRRDRGRSPQSVDVLQTPAFLCRQTDFIRAVRAERQAGEHQEGPVPRAARHEERDRQGARRGAREGPVGRPLHGLRARRELRLQQPRLRHALASRSCARPARRSCSTPRIRCSCPAARAPAPAASASSCRCWRAPRSPSGVAGALHGNASRSRRSAVRRPQRRAAAAHAGAARDAGRRSIAVAENGFLRTRFA